MKARRVVVLVLLLIILGSSVMPFLGQHVTFAETPSAWTQTANYSGGVLERSSCVNYNSYIYCVGGDTTGTVPLATTAYGLTSPTGISSWSNSTAYPYPIFDHACAENGGYVYCVGGKPTTTKVYAAANYAQLTSSGIGSWSSTTPYPLNITDSYCAGYSGYIYCVGGAIGGSTATNATYYASVSSSGIGTWTAGTQYPLKTYLHSCGIDSGYIYCVGGVTTSAVYYASVSSSGFGAWTSTTAYGGGTIYGLLCGTNTVVNYVYCVGGQNATVVTNQVYYASISSSGVGSWIRGPNYLSSVYDAACTPSSTQIYCVGGQNSSGTNLNLVGYTNLSGTTVTQPITCTMSNSAPQATLTLSGGSPSPSTVLCDGLSHNITVSPSTTLTATEPADSSTARDRFSGATTSLSTTSCSSGTCSPWAFTNYNQLNNTYEATPTSPSTWDGIYKINASGTYLGTASSAVCTITTSNGGGSAFCHGWSDYDLQVSLTSSFVSGSNTWSATAPYSFTDTTGGNTHIVDYSRASSNSGGYYQTTTLQGGKSLSFPNVTASLVPGTRDVYSIQVDNSRSSSPLSIYSPSISNPSIRLTVYVPTNESFPLIVAAGSQGSFEIVLSLSSSATVGAQYESQVSVMWSQGFLSSSASFFVTVHAVSKVRAPNPFLVFLETWWWALLITIALIVTPVAIYVRRNTD